MTIPLFKVFMSDDVVSPMKDVLTSGYIGEGSKVEEFEKTLRNFFGIDYLNTVNSCTSALHLALRLAKEAWHDEYEVLASPLTCTATNFAVMANSMRLRWVDVDLATGNMDLDDLERKISPRTKIVVVIHWGGYPVDLDRLALIGEKCFDLYGFRPIVIEDAAHAWGSTYKNRLIGTHGNFVTFSFQAIKHLTTGDGGLLISPNAEYHRRGKLMRWFGLDRTSSADFRCSQNIEEWGYKFHMNDIAACIGLYNFPHVSGLVNRHIENSDYLDIALSRLSGVTLLERKQDRKSAAWIYTLRVERRDDFKRAMISRGIHVSQVHARNDIHACLSEFKSLLPNMDIFDKDMICIPCGWWVSDSDREYIVNQIKLGW